MEFDEPLFNLTKLAIGQHTLPQLTFQYKGKSNKRFICWKGFSYSVRKIRQRIYLLFDLKELLTIGKNTWNQPIPLQKVPLQIHYKWLFWQGFVKSGNHTEIKNLSETYLKPSQRSMMELLFENSQQLVTVNYFRGKPAS